VVCVDGSRVRMCSSGGSSCDHPNSNDNDTDDFDFYSGGEACISTDVISDFDPNSLQNWIGQNEYGNTYYYPVIPKFDRFGQFIDNSYSKTPFGSNRE